MKTYSDFGMHKIPFTRELTNDEQFNLPYMDTALDGLRSAIEARMSAALIAPAGTGKTALLRKLREALPQARYKVHTIKVTGLAKRDFCREISCAIGASPAGTYPMLVRRLQERFGHSLSVDGLRPVILIDEAHDFKPSVLAILRLLTNFNMDSELVLSLILAGQPPLGALLQRDDLVAMSGRLAHIAKLRVMSRDESLKYLRHRVALAGSVNFPFDESSAEGIFEIARGNLRATDRLARTALDCAIEAGETVVTANHVVAARERLTV